MEIGVVSLGCPKNLVDSEVMMGLIQERNWKITNDPSQPDVIIVNTCGFIESAKTESINTILQMAEYKKEDAARKLIVTGCLGQRYADDLFKDLPEVDAIIGTECYEQIGSVIDRVQAGERFVLVKPPKVYTQKTKRVLATPKYTAYLKIAEGCNNRCSYCAIPKIRGPYRSRPFEEVLDEARSLVEQGVRELIVVAQDTTQYGIDLYHKLRLSELLKALNEIPDLRWIRVLYCYPDSFTDELIETMATCDKVCNYVDLPLQHASNSLLKTMRRRDTREQVEELLAKLRRRIPDICLRTTFIVGFPGETEEQFAELLDFVKKERFQCAGVFTYSQEEGTEAGEMENQIPEDVKQDRYHELMALQAEISEEIQQDREGRVLEVLIEGKDEEDPNLAVGRSYAEAPDIDGKIYVEDAGDLKIGDFVKVRISQGFTYEAVGQIVKE
ncbi:30S ribosomal protein S12 methylthiotransferase RimO [Acidaminococcus provencensis]|uniref:30S ribosomal protein S12 methylthiotransferase RimO n=1 Tax=Acidaminococcus provencensis TaxID=2058289 RepID=UPI000CF8B4CB|nr:30S ribosomal protein S12 methylthiotransferase RimO [Acidaminococcus provencensis]